MIYNTKEEALLTRKRFIEVNDSDEFITHHKKYYFYDADDKYDHRRFGKFFLYEKNIGNKLYYPQLAIYINELPCDQTSEVEYINYRRTWEWQAKYKYEYDGKEYTNYMAELGSDIDRFILWHDSMYVYGAWDKMPNWRELRQAYERTWWFHRTSDEIRDIQLRRILG